MITGVIFNYDYTCNQLCESNERSMSNRVSEAEKIVMDVLWQESPLTSLDVVERLADQDWTEKTVKSFLNRLVKKGVVTFTKDGRRYLYSPAIERDDFLASESEGFLDRVFKGI